MHFCSFGERRDLLQSISSNIYHSKKLHFWGQNQRLSIFNDFERGTSKGKWSILADLQNEKKNWAMAAETIFLIPRLIPTYSKLNRTNVTADIDAWKSMFLAHFGLLMVGSRLIRMIKQIFKLIQIFLDSY